ncbi:hypothetical protein BVC93_05310 [Mycobacterium sp. MS1601]|uniref:DUF3349 domain-containing protein n=1 Tax=Mycobacterium sp. MS1601 TaxID=1936029 RepID=UPI0009794A4B|nr:DUF3349 domain-containing protein [Mycobacterium sp. MS1601]AQA01944.1 hypothetical protein BVC93_05310 [Mycobacterium sp. MS1601]
MTESAFRNVVSWLNAGFPEGVPPKDHFALLALLKRTLSEEEVVAAARSILTSGDPDTPVTDEQIRDTITQLIDKDPNPEEMHQVSARLALVGWPLATPAN